MINNMNLTPEQLAGLSVIRKERGDPNKRGRGSKDLKGDTMGGKFDISSKSIKALMTTVERAIMKVTFSKDDESGAMEEESDSSDDDNGKIAKKQEATSKNRGKTPAHKCNKVANK
jgi:hypothetical protein